MKDIIRVIVKEPGKEAELTYIKTRWRRCSTP